ncbi:MAG: CpsD/CapB family tyrosine-protein kinase [Clostridia bacterium]|nr:CpsD/CapB family tyrosine-protein kinase [Clostridia bacterium]
MSIFKKNQIAVKREYLLSENVPFEVREAFRSLKASLCVSLPKKMNGEGIALLVTSACPEAGKTTVAVNLSLMLAESNARVLLIDADTRKGRVARYFGQNAQPGLVDCISGQASLAEVTHVYNEKFSYITCGAHSPRPYELLESDVMKALLSDLKKQYDYIVIDTPPVLLLSDALALIPESDGTVVVCRHRASHVNDIAKTLNTLNFAKANVLGVVVNDYTPLEKSKGRKYGGYRYYSNSYAAYYERTEAEKEVEKEAATTAD